MTVATTQVRRCPDCRRPTMVASVLWERKLGGTPSGSVQEYQCQACGARVQEPVVLATLARLVRGVLFTPILGVGLILIILEVRSLMRFRRSAIVPGAAVPQQRFAAGPCVRRCVCGQKTRITRVEKTTSGGILIGVEIAHKCGGCGRNYVFWPPLQMVTWVGLGLGVLTGAVAMVIYFAAWWAYAAAVVLALFGFAAVAVVVWSTIDRFRVPEVPSAEQLA